MERWEEKYIYLHKLDRICIEKKQIMSVLFEKIVL